MRKSKTLLALGAGLTSVVLLSGCSQSLYLEKSEIETEVARQVEEQVGVKPEITCPENLPGEVDATITCELADPDSDEKFDLLITATSVNTDTKEIEYSFEVVE